LLDVPELEIGLAWCAVGSGESNLAQTHLRRAILLQPSSSVSHQMRVDLFIFGGQPREAIEALLFKMSKVSDSVTDHLQLAELLVEVGDRRLALEQFRNVLERDPSSAVAHAHYGLLQRSLRNLPAAIEHLQAAIRLNRSSLSWGKELASTLVAAGREHEAEAMITSMLRDHPTDSDLTALLSAATKHSRPRPTP
jgi:predicted Zn-dependent protease